MVMAEAMAARRVALFVQEMCLSKVLVEGDCLRVVSALNTLVCCNTLYGNVIEETGRQASQFQACKLIHVRCGGNKLAHALARRAVSSADFDVWVEDLPLIWRVYSKMMFLNFLFYMILPFSQKKKKKKLLGTFFFSKCLPIF